MRIAVKVCGLTRPEDMVAAVEAGVDAVGVVFDRGPARVSFERGRTLLDAIRGASVERVAVVGSLDGLTRRRVSSDFDLLQVEAEAVTLEASERPHLPAFFDDEALVARVRAYRARGDLPPVRSGSLLGTVNVDGRGGGGTGQRADWGRAATLAREGALTLSGGLRVENLEAALRAVRPHAVDVSSGVASAAGGRDAQRMADFVAEVRRVERILEPAP